MALETGTYISDLVSTNPVGTDTLDKADDHLRLLKSTIKATFPNITGAVTPTHTELNFVDGVTSAIQTQLDAKANLPSAQSFLRNRLINGCMRVAQRATTYNLTNGLTYGSLDRFFAGQNTTAQSRFAQLAYNANNFQFIALLGRNAAATSTGVVYAGQTIEYANLDGLPGNQVTLSFYCYAGATFSAASSNISVNVISGTTADQGAASMVAGTWTGTSTLLTTTQAITTSFTRYTYTVSVPSNCKELGFYISYTPVGTAGADDNIYFTGVQLEAGSVATPFERRQYGQELALCQRYYYVLGGTSVFERLGSAQATSGTLAYAIIPTPVTLRSAPTVSYSGAFGVTSSSGAAISATNITLDNAALHSVQVSVTVASGLVAGNATQLIANNSTATRFNISAEL